MEYLNNPKKELKSFWRTDGMDWIADLNEMKKAIVVAYYTPIIGGNYYAISPRSYFPFSDIHDNKKFDNYYDCCIYAESIIIGATPMSFVITSRCSFFIITFSNKNHLGLVSFNNLVYSKNNLLLGSLKFRPLPANENP